MARRFKQVRRKPRNNFKRSPRRRKKRSSFNKVNYFTRKHPIATGVLLIIASFVLFRMSFTNSFLSSAEVFIWSVLLSIGLFIAGLLVLIAYWRNHVSMLTTRHSVRWR